MRKIWLSATLVALVTGAILFLIFAGAHPVEALPLADTAAHSKKRNVDFGPYMAELQRRIKRAWFPPKGSGSERTVAQFKVSKDGQVSDLTISRSSHVKRYDDAALEAVRDAHFDPLPAGAADTVDVQFTFDYNVWKGSKKLPPDDATADSGDAATNDEPAVRHSRSGRKHDRLSTSGKSSDEMTDKEAEEFWKSLVRTSTPIWTTALTVVQSLLALGIFLWLGIDWLRARSRSNSISNT